MTRLPLLPNDRGTRTMPSPLRHSRPLLLLNALEYFRSSGGNREPGFFNRRKLALLLAAVLYFISPIDLIPDMLPGVGQLDDGLLIVFTVAALLAPRRTPGEPGA